MNSRLLFAGLVVLVTVGCAQTDTGITTSVKSQLAADDLVKARRIDVDTRDRVVTLSGEVRTAREQDQALQIARNTDGVANVVDQLSVVPETRAAPTTGTERMPGATGAVTGDPGITATVKTKLLADPDVSGLRIDVDTREGVVTLTGSVGTQAQKTEAIRIARETDNVKNVVDRLTIEGRQ
jgi:hyperosmotically inducible periplasmic protein